MYDRHLETFLQAADSGSFLKASEQLYISATAVTKQINLLEERLNLKLFHRTSQGISLTKAGQLVYDEAKQIIRHSNGILRKAQALEKKEDFIIHIGVSLMNPATLLLELWDKTAERYPNLKLEIVPFEDTVHGFNEVLDHLGEKIDLVPCPYETNFWGDRYQSLHLWDLPLGIGCAKTHPLASRERLTVEDLHDHTLWVMERGRSFYQDLLRDDLEQNHPQINLKSGQYIDINSFNSMVSTQDLILTAPCWSSIHPQLMVIPVDWTYTIPYGLIYAKNPPQEITQFIRAVGCPDDVS